MDKDLRVLDAEDFQLKIKSSNQNTIRAGSVIDGVSQALTFANLL